MATWRATSSSRLGRAFLAASGCLSVAAGVVGIFVPGLPTTVFLLAASYLFARSSPQLRRRLLEDPHLGVYLRGVADRRAMPWRAKLLSLTAMWTGIALSASLGSGRGPVVLMVLLVLGLIGSVVVLFWVRTAEIERRDLSRAPADVA